MMSNRLLGRRSAVVFLALIWGFSLPVVVAFADPPGVFCHDTPTAPCGKAWAMMAQQAAQEALTEEQALDAGPREASTDTDLLHCTAEIEIMPGQTPNLSGTNTMTIQSKASALTQFTFRLRYQYTITSALINGTTPVSITTVPNTTRVATLDRAYGMNEIFTLTIAYNGTAYSTGFGSIEFTTHGGANIVTTLSEPYYAYTWWPVKDGDVYAAGDNGDKFTLEMAIISPSTMTTASNGTLQGVDPLSGGRHRTRWATSHPLSTYLTFFSSTNYNTWSLDYSKLAGGTMPVLFYIYPEDDNPSNRNAWGQAVQMITTLRDLYGEYPWVDEKYGIYEFPFGGGMEHQTFTGEGTFDESVTVHELGHQWWGDMVTCKTWNHIWLNEGFATYTEALWAEHKPGSSGLPDLKSAMAAIKYTGAGSVYVTDSELSSVYSIFDTSTTYDKGGWVLHMLRHVLGDTNFFNSLAAYRAAFFCSAATTEDFQAVCEAVSGKSLNYFFQEWIYGERAPAYAYGWQSLSVAGQNYLALYIDQTQSASYQRFSMPIDVRINGTNYTVFNSHDPENFVIPIPAPATTVTLDPDDWVLNSSKTTTTYVPGPPRIAQASPLPGTVLPCGTLLHAVTITFHTNVTTSAGQYTLVGATTGPRPVSFSYNSTTNTTTLTSAIALSPDTYTLTVSDAVTAVNSGMALDGEIADPNSPASLPSGNGVAGGSAVMRFTIAARPAADINGDCVRNATDVNLFVNVLLGIEHGVSYVANSDLDGNGTVDARDIQPFVTAYLQP
ncbi:MAG TPA: M1 family aminopeptidase [Phycisphaerae bacterium]|nr:M1 family aminopeptidase [Phycisphaerae bacterium]